VAENAAMEDLGNSSNPSLAILSIDEPCYFASCRVIRL